LLEQFGGGLSDTLARQIDETVRGQPGQHEA
jgi:hypothetical protein